MEVEVREGAVVDAAFAASACAIATASASLLTERVRGSRVDEVLRLSPSSAITALGDGVPAGRHGCASLALRVLQQALAPPS
jgi:nitrogen fixation NifU-like protein